MKGFTSLLLGICGTLAFSWLGLAFVPNLQFGHLEPQADEELTDIYPVPRSGMAERGRQIYVANGCFYCHSQQVRADYAASDIDRKWGTRRSAPRDYIYDRPVLLGKMRMGPDLANIGKRAPVEEDAPAASPGASPTATPAAANPAAANASPGGAPAATANAAASPVPSAVAKTSPVAATPAPSGSPALAATGSPAPAAAPAAAAGTSPAASPSAPPSAASTDDFAPTGAPKIYSAAWHHLHLYAPRSVNDDSNMPSYRFLYHERPIGGQIAADALRLTGDVSPKPGYEVVPTYDAKCLVAFLMSLDQSHTLNEVKSAAPAAAAASPAAGAAAPATVKK